MILGIGTDIIKITRLKKLSSFSNNELSKVFSIKELSYCFDNDNLICSRLAVCFSVKESFYKALSSALVKLNLNKVSFSFLFAAKNVSFLKTDWQTPILDINWKCFEKKINNKIPKVNCDISVSHEVDYVVSYIIISKN